MKITEHVEQSRVVLVADPSRVGTVVAVDYRDPQLVMVMWDKLRDGTTNVGGRAYWQNANSIARLDK